MRGLRTAVGRSARNPRRDGAGSFGGLAQHVGYWPARRPIRWVGEPQAEKDMGLARAASHRSDPWAQLRQPERLVRVRCKYAVRRCTQQHVLESLSCGDPCAHIVAFRPQDGNDRRVPKGMPGSPRLADRDHVGESVRVVVVLARAHRRVKAILTPQMARGRFVLLTRLENQIGEGALVGRRCHDMEPGATRSGRRGQILHDGYRHGATLKGIPPGPNGVSVRDRVKEPAIVVGFGNCGSRLDMRNPTRVGRIWTDPHDVPVSKVSKRDPGVEQRGTARDHRFALRGVPDWTTAGRVNTDVEPTRRRPKFPRLCVV